MKKLHPLYLILIFALVIRLVHLTFPVSGWHEWRQADTASIAKNFYEGGYDLINPEVNWGGTNHYIESEFQLYPFVVSLLYGVFGFNEAWGRLVSILCSLLTIYGLYLLVRHTIDKRTALWSAFIYSVLPLNIYFARVIMPESAMMMCIVFGIYFFYRWIETEKSRDIAFSCLFTTIAVLLKIPTLYIGLPLLYLAYQKYKVKTFINGKLILYTIAVLIPTTLWYYHAHQLYVTGGSTFQIWEFGSDKWGNFNLWIKPGFYYDIIIKSLGERHLTYPGLIICIMGFFIRRQYKYEKVFDMWLISLAVYVLIAAQGNRQHDYYQLPLILPLSVYIGKVFSKYLQGLFIDFRQHARRNSFFVVVLLMIFYSSWWRMNDLIKRENPSLGYFKVADGIKKATDKKSLIITVTNGNPIYLYTADRKGWMSMPEEFDNKYLTDKIKQGAVALTGEKHWIDTDKSRMLFNDAMKNYRVIESNDDYFLIDLTKKN